MTTTISKETGFRQFTVSSVPSETSDVAGAAEPSLESLLAYHRQLLRALDGLDDARVALIVERRSGAASDEGITLEEFLEQTDYVPDAEAGESHDS